MVPYMTRGKKLKRELGAVVKPGDVSLALRLGKWLGAGRKARKCTIFDCGPHHARIATILILILPSISCFQIEVRRASMLQDFLRLACRLSSRPHRHISAISSLSWRCRLKGCLMLRDLVVPSTNHGKGKGGQYRPADGGRSDRNPSPHDQTLGGRLTHICSSAIFSIRLQRTVGVWKQSRLLWSTELALASHGTHQRSSYSWSA